VNVGSPSFLKWLIYLGMAAALAYGAVTWLEANPEPDGISNIQQDPYRAPQPPNVLDR